MSLRERLGTAVAFRPGPDNTEASQQSRRAYQAMQMRLHQAVLERIDLAAMEILPVDEMKDALRTMVERLLAEENQALNSAERRSLVRDIQDEMLGLGPLEPLLADPSVSDILVNTASQVYVERRGQLELTDVVFADDDHLMKTIDKIVSRVGRRIDESSPMVDARLPDGSRVNAIIPPLAIDGPVLSIRRFGTMPLQMGHLLAHQSLSEEMATFLGALAQVKVNLVISGGTGSGKTTLLNILSSYIPAGERIITIEDAAELQLQQPHVVRLETRPPNIEGRGEVAQRALLRNALRMRPDRIILGETRGSEALDMLQAMNTGHEGSMTTIHANTARDALTRLETMIAMAGVDLPAKAARAQVASAIGYIVQVNRLSDGSRRVTSVQEVSGLEGDVITLQEIFSFRQTGLTATGTVQGHFAASGVRPRVCELLASRGVRLPDQLFQPLRRLV